MVTVVAGGDARPITWTNRAMESSLHRIHGAGYAMKCPAGMGAGGNSCRFRIHDAHVGDIRGFCRVLRHAVPLSPLSHPMPLSSRPTWDACLCPIRITAPRRDACHATGTCDTVLLRATDCRCPLCPPLPIVPPAPSNARSATRFVPQSDSRPDCRLAVPVAAMNGVRGRGCRATSPADRIRPCPPPHRCACPPPPVA